LQGIPGAGLSGGVKDQHDLNKLRNIKTNGLNRAKKLCSLEVHVFKVKTVLPISTDYQTLYQQFK